MAEERQLLAPLGQGQYMSEHTTNVIDQSIKILADEEVYAHSYATDV
jgi:hypothetical protein